MHDGFRERSFWGTFRATTKQGEPLPPGDYIAALKIEGYSARIEAPVNIP